MTILVSQMSNYSYLVVYEKYIIAVYALGTKLQVSCSSMHTHSSLVSTASKPIYVSGYLNKRRCID